MVTQIETVLLLLVVGKHVFLGMGTAITTAVLVDVFIKGRAEGGGVAVIRIVVAVVAGAWFDFDEV